MDSIEQTRFKNIFMAYQDMIAGNMVVYWVIFHKRNNCNTQIFNNQYYIIISYHKWGTIVLIILEYVNKNTGLKMTGIILRTI
jgi:hypothetical protein